MSIKRITNIEKLISIIIPCYNAEYFIDRCLYSLIRQTIGISCLEIICVDDASTDHTWDRLNQWEKAYPDSIILIQHPENLRQGGARNTGIRRASAPYVAFVDADDWVEDRMYQKLYEKQIEFGCDITGCLQKRVYGSYETLTRKKDSDSYFIYNTEEQQRKLMKDGLRSGNCTRLYHTATIIDNGLWFPERTAYEDNYWADIYKLYIDSYYLIEEELYHYAMNVSSTTMKLSYLDHIDRMTMEQKKLKVYQNLGIYQQFRQEIEIRFLRLYYINTLYTFFTRCNDFTFNAMKRMQKAVWDTFPDWEENKYIITDLIEDNKRLLYSLKNVNSEQEFKTISNYYKEKYT